MKLIQKGKTIEQSAAKTGISDRTARKWLNKGHFPSELEPTNHSWRTRGDPFEEDWAEIEKLLTNETGLQAKTVFAHLQRCDPGKYSDGQLRTLQRRFKVWRGTKGPAKEVFFSQEHKPGKLGQSDFTHMNNVRITISGQPFDHMLYHFALTYSNWEYVMVCYSESYESLSEGLQGALWALGGAPEEHCTDQLSAAVRQLEDPKAFTERYNGLLRHYGLRGRYIQAGKANENGDVEQSNYRIKEGIDQDLMLRGSRDFDTMADYTKYLRQLIRRRNAGRIERFSEERKMLRALPSRRQDAFKRERLRVNKGSLIHAAHNVYSVHSRLIGEKVDVRLYMDRVEVWYGQKRMEVLPRLRGRGGHHIQYRHIIDWLVRKPGAFENYRYRDVLFPTSRFRMAWDWLRQHRAWRANREYLKILELAAKQSEAQVDSILGKLVRESKAMDFEIVEQALATESKPEAVTDVKVEMVNLSQYDQLLQESAHA